LGTPGHYPLVKRKGLGGKLRGACTVERTLTVGEKRPREKKNKMREFVKTRPSQYGERKGVH